MKRYAVILCFILLLAPLAACGEIKGERDENNPVATIELQSGGSIYVELYPDVAPNTVANYISLANSGFYDGLTFHRINKGFVVQGGDPQGDGSGGPGYSIRGEFAQNGHKENNISHLRGMISMARELDDPDSAGSQFFIMHEKSPNLDGYFAAFGRVIRGMDVVDKLAETPVDELSGETPLVAPVIKSIRVDTKGTDYGEPVVITD